ncbi:MAG: 16S rRNA (adenine(1518)-N(6)/adenine(1519)-N(6))-dimethyltransferase RsmA [Clostridiales bacterium]|nr:16S rRNA (adenine(1518)-N(6)/adenine(1519)-N(6))-dimethyltransferase RsmA [Clostridiales bacterium]
MKLTDLGVIKDLFTRHGFSFTKSLGQNFLINPSICPKIAEMGGCDREICSLEIGTGIGVLTKELAIRSKKTVAIEIDRGLEPILAETLAEISNVEVIFADFMEIDLKKLFEEKFKDEEVVVCANLPYYITSPVIMRILEEKLPVKSLTVMVQKEAAERICAKVGTRECGALTVAVNYYSDPKKLFNVTRGSFAPAPNVDSSVIRLDIAKEKKYDVKDEKLFFRVIKSAFSQRRKQMINPLSAELALSKPTLSGIAENSGIKASARAEELSMEDFVQLCNGIYDHFND